MAAEESRTCIECDGTMSPIVIMDKHHSRATGRGLRGFLEYRQPDDRVSFWTGKYPSAGPVQAFLCADCGRIALYGSTQDAGEQDSTADESETEE